MNLTQSDRDLAEKFSGPVLSIEMEAATEDEEPISPSVLRASLEAHKEVSKAFSAWMRGESPSVFGSAVGRSENAAIWLEAELKRTGVLS
jgi:hypothetical protein